jgi:hypothetical protein
MHLETHCKQYELVINALVKAAAKEATKKSNGKRKESRSSMKKCA